MDFTVKHVASFSEVLRDSRFLRAVTCGPRNEILILTLELNGRYAISELVGDQWQMRLSLESDEAFQFVQPMPDGNFLLVDSRLTKIDTRDPDVAYHPGKYFDNAHVFDRSGKKLYGFMAGDGIGHVQTTVNGEIWIAFFDEGVFGDPSRTGGLAAAGLVCLNAQGKVLFRYSEQIAESNGIPTIDDCYALNVMDQDEVWLCYYGDFPVVSLSNKTLTKAWIDFPRRAAKAFAVCGETLLMVSAYRGPRWLYVDLNSRVLTDTPIVDETGSPIDVELCFARGNTIYFGAKDCGLYAATLPK